MKNTLLPTLACLGLLAFDSGCQQNDTPEPVVLPNGPLTITLKTGQSQQANSLSVKLVSIREGRCAREDCYRCIGGYATVVVDLAIANQAAQRLSFQRPSCLSPRDLTFAQYDSLTASVQQAAGYQVGLINMTDLVRANNLATSDYEVKFLLVKK